MSDVTEPISLTETPARLRRGLSLGSIVLLIGVAMVAVVFGVALARQNTTQPTDGPAPDFALTTFDGEPIRLSDLRGQIVIVNFWASWCGPCRDEAPALQAVWERYQDQGVVVLGVAYTDIEADSREFINEFGLTYPNGPDLGTEISKQRYHIVGVPETFVIDQTGNVAEFIYAQVSEAGLTATIERLLAQG
ncbi:MAG: redoxin domain-containing protein [Burkholderiales bacterium]|nr:redoxin domain-containing protein [Anaerolineae bacterium]